MESRWLGWLFICICIAVRPSGRPARRRATARSGACVPRGSSPPPTPPTSCSRQPPRRRRCRVCTWREDTLRITRVLCRRRRRVPTPRIHSLAPRVAGARGRSSAAAGGGLARRAAAAYLVHACFFSGGPPFHPGHRQTTFTPTDSHCRTQYARTPFYIF